MTCSKCGVEIPDGRDPCASCAEHAATLTDGAWKPEPSSPDAPTAQDETRLPAPGGPSRPSGPVSAAYMQPGQPFGGRYRIIRELGRGGMGVVYQAWDDELSTAVALKVVLSDPSGDAASDQARERRFKQELLLARQVTHKNVIRIHDLGEINGIKYFTMPFVKGETLSSLLRREGRLPVPRAIEIARQAIAGLAAAHEVGIVHRDLKPANIMIDDEGLVQILDFGIARSVTGPGAGTSTGALMGTLDYMSPEQTMGANVDQRADVYAFGLILSELLVGRHAAGTAGSTLAAVIERARKAPAPIRTVDPNIPEAVERIISRCLQPEPADRFQTSADLEAELKRLDADGQLPLQVTAGPPRPKWLVPAFAGAFVLVAGLAAWFYVVSRPNPPAPPAAQEVVSVLIANFDNKTGDAMFDGALEQPLAIALEGASFITAAGHADAERTLATISKDARLNEEGARLMARRDGTKVVLSGTIAPKGSEYALSVRIIDPTVDAPLKTIETVAHTKADVLNSVGSLVGQIRTALGDTTTGAALAAAAETFTTTSLDAIKKYSTAQDMSLRRKDPEAITWYQQAIASDPKFGRAYAGWGVSALNLGRKEEAAEMIGKALPLMDRMTDREKYRTLGAYFSATGDFDKAVENYRKLVQQYPADTAGHANLAYNYFFQGNFKGSLEENRVALRLRPNSAKWLSNNALYAMYAGDFAAAATDGQACLKVDPSFAAYLPIAIADLAQGKTDAAREWYRKMAAVDATGRSRAADGLADIALYEGRPADAHTILSKGIADDTANKDTGGLIRKHLAAADAFLMEGKAAEAWEAAKRASALSKEFEAAVPAARMAVAAAKNTEARALAAALSKQISVLPRSYAKVIDAEVALRQKKYVEAIDTLKSAIAIRDTWLARFDLGIAYAEAGMFAQALNEFDTCDKRRGEATSVFYDDYPTFRYLAPLQYWLGRAKEGLGMKPAALTHYQAYLALRPAGLKDPLADDARSRTGSK